MVKLISAALLAALIPAQGHQLTPDDLARHERARAVLVDLLGSQIRCQTATRNGSADALAVCAIHDAKIKQTRLDDLAPGLDAATLPINTAATIKAAILNAANTGLDLGRAGCPKPDERRFVGLR